MVRCFGPLMLGLALLFAFPAMAQAAGPDKPRTHTVYRGQRLGSIAKRYRVTVEALCNANRISASDPIHPGQKLLIPDEDDEDGSEARKYRDTTSRTKASRATKSSGRGPSGERHHKVYPGHTLGKIARRYHVTVDAICTANGIRETDPIKPGQVLVIPGSDDPDGTKARKANPPGKRRASSRSRSGADNDPKIHKVYPGHTLGKVAKRYNVSIDALCHANGIRRTTPIKPGQKLIIPTADDPDGKHARHLRASGYLEKKASAKRSSKRSSARAGKSASKSWKDYQKPAWRRGYITLVGYHETWKGYVIGPGNKVLPGARKAVSRVMGASGDRPRADWRLVRLIAKVSDTFGGRPIRVVSGYRTESYSLNSRHKKSQAIDFSIPGVPNEALRDYLLTFANVGVGYYPNSSFVHLDVRDKKTYWVDVSGPGEPPRYVK
jgi:LysM repeat protein